MNGINIFWQRLAKQSKEKNCVEKFPTPLCREKKDLE